MHIYINFLFLTQLTLKKLSTYPKGLFYTPSVKNEVSIISNLDAHNSSKILTFV